jgi:peptidylprolyl isomerase
MVRVQVLSDISEAERPKIRVIDTKSAYFHALAKRSGDDLGDRFTPCDVEVAGELVK